MPKVLFSPIVLRTACIAGIVGFLARAGAFWADGGLFYSFGIDYAIYGSAAEVAGRSGWPAIYDSEALTQTFAGWLAGGLDRSEPSTFAAYVYPVPFLLPFFAMNLLGHLGGFAAWTILNVVLYVAIVRGLAGADHRRDPLMSLAPLAFLPFLFGLYVGQAVVVMAFGLYRSLRAFDQGREWAAGCWLGLLLVKPQMGLVMVPILLIKRRWSALAGLGLVGAGLAGSTLALVGGAGVHGYLETARAFSGFRQLPRVVYPWDMINVRGLMVQLLPDGVGEAQGLRGASAVRGDAARPGPGLAWALEPPRRPVRPAGARHDDRRAHGRLPQPYPRRRAPGAAAAGRPARATARRPAAGSCRLAVPRADVLGGAQWQPCPGRLADHDPDGRDARIDRRRA